jgi:hypothetical protein
MAEIVVKVVGVEPRDHSDLTMLTDGMTLLWDSPRGRAGCSATTTLTGPKGFQVSVIHSLHGTHLIGDFGSLQAAQIFADAMREIDLIATAAQDRSGSSRP